MFNGDLYKLNVYKSGFTDYVSYKMCWCVQICLSTDIHMPGSHGLLLTAVSSEAK
jgi:hypothetical protein